MQNLRNIRRVAEEEEIWSDVGWSAGGFSGNWAQPIEDSVNPLEYSSLGLAPVYAAAHDTSGGGRAIMTTLWFVSEMVTNTSCSCGSPYGRATHGTCVDPRRPAFSCSGAGANSSSSYLWRNHREWLSVDRENTVAGRQTFKAGTGTDTVINYCNAEALEWMIDYLSDAITSWQVSATPHSRTRAARYVFAWPALPRHLASVYVSGVGPQPGDLRVWCLARALRWTRTGSSRAAVAATTACLSGTTTTVRGRRCGTPTSPATAPARSGT